jgi:hypothetical protein
MTLRRVLVEISVTEQRHQAVWTCVQDRRSRTSQLASRHRRRPGCADHRLRRDRGQRGWVLGGVSGLWRRVGAWPLSAQPARHPARRCGCGGLATCSGDNCRPSPSAFLHRLTMFDVIAHGAHPAGPCLACQAGTPSAAEFSAGPFVGSSGCTRGRWDTFYQLRHHARSAGQCGDEPPEVAPAAAEHTPRRVGA